ncbi:aminotransferase class V-fold PLP-dependent enzyme, partial [Candidatus Microgenomates bacterium]|nr:aminotransferase class V-fold PLP-dependent enzyme [Candidatus Microgenomates bacterium]
MRNFKQDFPIFKRKINGKPLVYLDSASTSQKPQAVIDAVVNVYKNSNANIHRGIYTISEEATKLFENAREKVAKFINAQDAKEIIFTRNATEALNLAAYGLGQTLKKGDAILISEMEHHSNIVPWQRIAKEKGVRLFFLMINDEGLMINEVADEKNKVVYKNFTEIPNLKIVSLVHVSNVLGTINPIREIISKIHPRGVHSATSGVALDDSPEVNPIVVIDAAQSVPHMPIDVQKLDCDFLAFSGHKMLAPTGVGVLYGKKKLLEKMEPLLVGSHMISEVTKEKATWNILPWKFEPGTAAIEAVVGLGAAI